MTLDQWCKNEGWHLDEASQEFRDFGREIWDYQQASIALLESLLKRRDRGMHTIGQHEQVCPGRYPSGRCICGHDDVAKYFREQGE